MQKSAQISAAAIAIVLLGAAAATQVPAAQAPSGAWPKPDPDSLPNGALKDTVLYGRKLFVETYSVIGPEVSNEGMRYAGNNLACQNCHLDAGRQRYAIPMIGVFSAFPA